jgi:arylsulfatase A-like enzyme
MNRDGVGVLWSRLVCLACTMAVVLCGISTLMEIDGWRAYETGSELLHEIGARLILSIGVAAIVGTAAAIVALPYVLADRASIEARCRRVVQFASSVVALGFAAALVGLLIRWATRAGLLAISQRASMVLWLGLTALLVCGYLLRYRLLGSAQARQSPDFVDTFSGKVTRRLVLISGAAGLLTAFHDTKPARAPRGVRLPRQAPAPNVILVTFDALSAGDISCYGYPLQTTPNIDALARVSHLFSHYYAVSTFTTSNVVSMLSGRYPSSTRVYHYGGKLHGVESERTLPRELRKAGYRTLASVANPGAHPGCLGFGADFDDLPAAPIADFVTRETAAVFQSAQLADEAGVAARLVPYTLEQMSPRLFGQKRSSAPPALSFAQAEALLEKVQSPYFLWVHTFAPHFPYLPDPPYLHRFLADDELRTHAEFANMVDLKGYSYSLARQPIVDKARLRYDEWIAQADDAFGRFMAMLRDSGRLQDTAVIVSADHGESFAGGYVGHGGADLRRPILHVPLLIHLPGQTRGGIINDVADQTALAPTILELVGSARPPWMEGRSLGPLLQSSGTTQAAAGSDSSLAFAQYLEPNSVFGAVTRGTMGVIDGHNQYVLTLDDGRGVLYDLEDSDRQVHNRAGSQPELAARLRAQIAHRFPALLGEKA